MRQEAELRNERLPLASSNKAALGPEHPARSCPRRRHAEANQRLHVVHSSWQGAKATAPSSSELRRQLREEVAPPSRHTVRVSARFEAAPIQLTNPLVVDEAPNFD